MTAEEILKKLNLQRPILNQICDIIGHHPREKETPYFQILYEADWLVNLEEGGLAKDQEKLKEIVEKEFKTVTGKKLA